MAVILAMLQWQQYAEIQRGNTSVNTRQGTRLIYFKKQGASSLSISIESFPKTSARCSVAVRKASQVLGMIRKATEKKESIFMPLSPWFIHISAHLTFHFCPRGRLERVREGHRSYAKERKQLLLEAQPL